MDGGKKKGEERSDHPDQKKNTTVYAVTEFFLLEHPPNKSTVQNQS